jgi:hypothetical protein
MAGPFLPLRQPIQSKPPVGAQLRAGHPLAQGLVCCALFNEGGGTIAYDITGNCAPGTITAFSSQSLSWTSNQFPGIVNGTATFTSPSGISQNTWTLEGLFSTSLLESSGNNGCRTLQVKTAGEDLGYSISSGYKSGHLALILDPVAWYDCGSSATINQLHHMVLVRSGGTNTAYLDGVQIFQQTNGFTGGNITQIIVNDSPEVSTTNYNLFCAKGSFYSRALSLVEIQQLYTDPFCFMQPRKGYLLAPVSIGTAISIAWACPSEWLATQACKAPANDEWLATQTIGRNCPEESIASASIALRLPGESLLTARAAPGLSEEWLGTQRSAPGLPGEEIATARNALGLPDESVAAARSAPNAPLESTAGQRRTAPSPAESLATQIGIALVPLEVKATSIRSMLLPDEWVAALRPSSRVPLESALAMRASQVLPTETLLQARRTASVFAEWIGKQRTAFGLPLESLSTSFAVVASSGLPLEIVAAVTVRGPAAEAWLGTLDTVSALPEEWQGIAAPTPGKRVFTANLPTRVFVAPIKQRKF